MTDPSGVPLMLDLRGRRIVVVGGGPVAAAKIRSLRPLGAHVTVIAPAALPAIAGAAADPSVEGAVDWQRRAYRDGDLAGAHLAVAATGEEDVDAAVAKEADGRGILCVRVDGGGTAALMAAVRRGPVTIAVSTGGRSPALARRIRQEVAGHFGEEYGAVADLLGELREDPRVRDALDGVDDAERAARWRRVLDLDIVGALRTGHLDSAKELALACLSSSSG